MKSSVIVAHPGAREHYALATAAHKAGMLARLITDFWNPFGEMTVELAKRCGIPVIQRLAQRRVPTIPSDRVVAFYSQAIAAGFRQRSMRGIEATYYGFEHDGRAFAERAKRYCDVEHDLYFGYSCASLEVLQHERRNGIRTIVDQTGAAAIAEEIRIEEESRNRDLSLQLGGRIPTRYFERLQQEWAEASRVVVNSQWSRSALVRQGVPNDKLHVVPLMYQPTPWAGPPTRVKGILRVLWLGKLSLLKGIAYALEAARLLEGSGIEFTFTGPLEIAVNRLRLPSNARYSGAVARNKVGDVYRVHDVFLFPTLSDGFGMTQLEAMSHGLPVIATVRCGTVVQHGVSGLLVQPADTHSIVEALVMLKSDCDRLEALSSAAFARSREFTPERIWPQYLRAMEESSGHGLSPTLPQVESGAHE
jgi:glycosyltransferase involved in cell wall biosynthesis